MITDWSQLTFLREGRFDAVVSEIEDFCPDFLPQYDDIFKAYKLCPLKHVKVVIVGQDPYPTPGHANGLAFSVNPDVQPLPQSLQNIFRELTDDIGCEYPKNGTLYRWAYRGVLLINSCLTVTPYRPGSHRGLGWEQLTDEVIRRLANETKNKVFILWGRHAQAYAELIDPTTHLILQAPHPSPLSAYHGFFGSRPFSKANVYLEATNQKPINWDLNWKSPTKANQLGSE